MTSPKHDGPDGPGPDPARSHLRAVVAAVDLELLRLPRRTTSVEGTDGLFDRWSELVKLLDLGPEPQLRPCPTCSKLAMRDATACGYCWSRLSAVPLAPVSEQSALGL